MKKPCDTCQQNVLEYTGDECEVICYRTCERFKAWRKWLEETKNDTKVGRCLQEVLLLPLGKAILLEGLSLKDATRVRVAAWKRYQFHTKLESDGNSKWRLTLYR